ncbi:unnamed protein product, partial [Heterotrigona itama]
PQEIRGGRLKLPLMHDVELRGSGKRVANSFFVRLKLVPNRTCRLFRFLSRALGFRSESGGFPCSEVRQTTRRKRNRTDEKRTRRNLISREHPER